MARATSPKSAQGHLMVGWTRLGGVPSRSRTGSELASLAWTRSNPASAGQTGSGTTHGGLYVRFKYSLACGESIKDSALGSNLSFLLPTRYDMLAR
jgi:hypothetical protein